MPVRLRITILFTLMVFVVLGIVCSFIYYYSYKSRRDAIRVRLSNRAITTATFLSKSELFDRQLIQRIDSLTTLSLKEKSVQAYNDLDKRIYNYSDLPGDAITIDSDILNKARLKSNGYFFERLRRLFAGLFTDFSSPGVFCGTLETIVTIGWKSETFRLISFNILVSFWLFPRYGSNNALPLSFI